MSAATPPPPPPPPPPPSGNINIPRAPSAPYVAPVLEVSSSENVSALEAGLDIVTLLISLTAFVLLYLDLFQKTHG